MVLPIIGGILIAFDLVDIAVWHFTGRGILDTLFGVPVPEDVAIEMGTSFLDFLVTSTIPLTAIVGIILVAGYFAFKPIR